jgi:hypothetical protein
MLKNNNIQDNNIQDNDIQDDDIQDNVSVLLDNYPFYKVFSKQEKVDMFSDENLEILMNLRNMLFRINFEDNKPISITPIIRAEYLLYSDSIKNVYNNNKDLINNYINYQVINSGILNYLSNIPSKPKSIIDEKKNEIPFNTCICLSLNANDKSIINTSYHNDSTIFQILQYSNINKPFVLGSELLFYHENNDTVIHQQIIEKAGDTNEFEFPADTMGDLIHEKYELVKEIYNKIKNKGNLPPLFRNKLRNGDTIVFPDTLWKHAVINTNEKKEENILHIQVANKNRETDPLDVQVCSERIDTNETDVHGRKVHYDGRRVIGLFCFIYSRYIKQEQMLDTFLLKEMKPITMSTINLNEKQCINFLSSMSNDKGCIKIDDVKIISRGGNKRKKRVKNTKRKTSKQKKGKQSRKMK